MNARGYKLKDFSRLTNLSRKALLLYEKRGLLVPDVVDERTGYRYYSTKQVRKAAMLAFLRNLDVPLNDIPGILEGSVSVGTYFIETGKRTELIRQQIKVGHALTAIQICESNERFLDEHIDVVVVPQTPVLSLECRGELKEIPLYYSLVNRFMAQYTIRSTGCSFTYYYRDSTRDKAHFKICCPLDSLLTIHHSDIRCEMFPSVRVALLRHFGDYGNMGLTYAALNEGIINEGLKSCGEYLEYYVIYGDKKHTDSSTFVTTVAGILE